MLKNPEIEDLYEPSLPKKSTEIQASSIFKRILHEITEDEENSVSIITCLKKGKNIDEEIAEEMKVGLNVVRRVLYKLHDVGLASYKRSKDPETQWYNYSWKFEENRLFEIIENKYNDARMFEKITPAEMMDLFNKKDIKAGTYEFFDLTAIQIINRSKIRTVIVNGNHPKNLIRAIKGEKIGTIITSEK